MSSVVYQSFNQINEVGEVKLFKSHRPDYKHGEQLRDFVYVKDVVRAMIELIEAGKKKPTLSGIYNLGTGEARSFHCSSPVRGEAFHSLPNSNLFSTRTRRASPRTETISRIVTFEGGS